MIKSEDAWEGLQKAMAEVAECYDTRTETQKLCQYVFRNPLVAIGPALWLVGRWTKMGWCQQKPKKLESIIEIR